MGLTTPHGALQLALRCHDRVRLSELKPAPDSSTNGGQEGVSLSIFGLWNFIK